MSGMLANISGIIPSSVIDGSGNRMVIFFQSCNLNCMYCHNSHTIGICNLCGTCVEHCPTQSLHIENGKMNYRAETCTHCDRCLKVCPENSNPQYQKMSVSDLLMEIRKVKDFISGITVSGGEVMLQANFVRELFAAIKQDQELNRLSLLVDSNGNVEPAKWDLVLDLADGFMIDIKAYSLSIHKEITGSHNLKILESIRYLDQKNKLTELRLVLVPEYNNSSEELEQIANFLNRLQHRIPLVIIALRKHGIREAYQFLQEPTTTRVQQAIRFFKSFGMDVRCIQ